MISHLNFNVMNQIINRTDMFEPVAKSKNYLLAYFEFMTDDWNDIDTKTAIFTTEDNESYKAVITDGLCFVPFEALQNSGYLYVSVYGGDRITTNSAQVFINESGFVEDEEPEPQPEPTDPTNTTGDDNDNNG